VAELVAVAATTAALEAAEGLVGAAVLGATAASAAAEVAEEAGVEAAGALRTWAAGSEAAGSSAAGGSAAVPLTADAARRCFFLSLRRAKSAGLRLCLRLFVVAAAAVLEWPSAARGAVDGQSAAAVAAEVVAAAAVTAAAAKAATGLA